MKKFATLALLAAAASGAYAQSSVTLFGIVDEAARYTKNGDVHQDALVSGGLNTSRIGFRGYEDLGSGLRAGFWLESGISANSGANSDSSRFFNRRSTVSLISDSLGELRLGRDYTPTYLGYTDYDVFGDNGVAASSKFDISMGVSRDGQTGVGQYTNSGETRADNQIQYFTPTTLGGFYARGSVASSNGVVGKRYLGGRLGYGAGPFDVSASYGEYKVAPAFGQDEFKTGGAGASYDFGVVKVLAYYNQSKFVDQKIQTYSIGAVAPIGLGQVRAQITHAKQTGTAAVTASGYIAGVTNTDGDGANQYALGYIYNLSKRTAIYTTAAYVQNKGSSQFAAGSTTPSIAAGAKSRAAEVGIRHSF